jgi:uncharacterized protein with PQ loop repeat
VLSSSISIACWVVVFSPQIIENFRRGSADGLSLVFLVVWLAGDVFNILGAVLQGVLPTMIILAVYYTLADIVLLAQCFYYRGFTLSDAPTAKAVREDDEATTVDDGGEPPSERSALLGNRNRNGHTSPPQERARRPSFNSFRERLSSIDGTHLSPATPLLDASTSAPAVRNVKPTSTLQTFIFNTFAIALVCAAGILGWYVSVRTSIDDHDSPKPDRDTLSFNTWGQFFGYLCAIFYLSSRLPQLLLNFRRKSTDGVSLLFFLFACVGNLTYVLSIVAYTPVCERRRHCQPGESRAIYAKYIAVNASWLVGSLGTLMLDLGIFAQFFLYGKGDGDRESDDEGED